MSIESENDIRALLRVGRAVALALQEMHAVLRPGITTAELDAVGAKVLEQHGARSAPQLVYRFPTATCISINDEAAHGIAGSRVVQEGDLVNLDVSAELDGYFADSGMTVPVPPVAPEDERLCMCARDALNEAIQVARAGRRMNAIGRAVENVAGRCGFRIIRDLGGHGVGRGLHEEPRSVPNYFTNRAKQVLREGMVFTLEPFFTHGSGRIFTADDGWTIKTADGQRVAQYEHTIIVTSGEPIIVTTSGGA